MSLVDANAPVAGGQIGEAGERVAYHKAKAKFWRSVASEVGDPHSLKMAVDHERFMRAWAVELEALRLAAATGRPSSRAPEASRRR